MIEIHKLLSYTMALPMLCHVALALVITSMRAKNVQYKTRIIADYAFILLQAFMICIVCFKDQYLQQRNFLQKWVTSMFVLCASYSTFCFLSNAKSKLTTPWRIVCCAAYILVSVASLALSLVMLQQPQLLVHIPYKLDIWMPCILLLLMVAFGMHERAEHSVWGRQVLSELLALLVCLLGVLVIMFSQTSVVFNNNHGNVAASYWWIQFWLLAYHAFSIGNATYGLLIWKHCTKKKHNNNKKQQPYTLHPMFSQHVEVHSDA